MLYMCVALLIFLPKKVQPFGRDIMGGDRLNRCPALIFFLRKGEISISNIKFIIDDDVLDDYFEYYKSIHPKAKKKPITTPYHPSINTWCILPRLSMNNLKQKWKDFIVWLVTTNGFNDTELDDFDVKYVAYFGTNRRHDVDNQVPKFILDGFTTSGLIVDDDDKHLHKLTLSTGYDKYHPRAEITIIVK